MWKGGIAMKEDPAVGGQGLPRIVSKAANEYLVVANFVVTAFGTLGHGVGKLVKVWYCRAKSPLPASPVFGLRRQHTPDRNRRRF